MNSKKLNITANDGTAINAKLVLPPGEPKGAVMICHGFGEHMAMYQEAAEVFVSAGYAAVPFDQRGHGEACSKKTYGVIPGYDSFLDDLDAVKKGVLHAYPGIPLFLYGHSMGGNIAVNYLLERGQQDITAAILETPWLRLTNPIPRPVVHLARGLGKISRRLAIINKLEINDISRDEERRASFQNDRLYHNRISLRMFAGITDAGERAIQNADKLTIPVLLACAEMDKIVSPDAVREFGKRANSNVVLKPYPQAYHALHNDLVRDVFYRDVLAFLDSVG